MLDDDAKAALESSLMALKGSLESKVKVLKHDPKLNVEAFKRDLKLSVEAFKHDPRMIKLIDTHQALNTLEGILELPQTSLAQVFGLKPEEKKDD